MLESRSMKKLLGIIVLSLLLQGCATVYESEHGADGDFKLAVEFKNQSLLANKPKADKKCQSLDRGNAINMKVVRKGNFNDYTIYTFDCEVTADLIAKQKIAEKKLEEEKNEKKLKKDNKIRITKMIEDSKTACKLLGMKEGTEKFSDCALKLYTQKVELAGQKNQQVIVQGQSTGSNVTTIYDPVRDSRALIQQGQRMMSGACTLGINC